ncbi:MAG: CRISPR-associated protein Csm2 [Thermosipho sp. (in: thermotogales)]|nr:CRISPR-associated protein Csm2 [Thermosipho sp. (in: thermotogales)]
MKDFSNEKINYWINEGIAEKILDEQNDKNGRLLFEKSEEIAKNIAKSNLNSTQLRKYFNYVKKISTDKQVYELNKFLAVFLYSVKRANVLRKPRKNEKENEKYEIALNFVNSIKTLTIVAVKKGNALQRYKDFFEALIAYYKYYSSENK